MSDMNLKNLIQTYSLIHFKTFYLSFSAPMNKNLRCIFRLPPLHLHYKNRGALEVKPRGGVNYLRA